LRTGTGKTGKIFLYIDSGNEYERKIKDEALYILKTKAEDIDKQIYDILQNTNNHFTSGQRLRHKGYKLIDKGVTKIGRSKRKLV
jgi:hypothetical protein